MRKYLYIIFLINCVFYSIYAKDNPLVGLSLLGEFPPAYEIKINDNSFLTLYWFSTSDFIDYDQQKRYSYTTQNHEKYSYLTITGKLPYNMEDKIYSNVSGIQWDNKIQFLYGKFKNAKRSVSNELYYPYIFIGYNKIKNTNKGDTFLFNFPLFEATSREYIQCSSELVEGDRKYSIENLNNLAEDTPWVEGVKGNGIGESFVIKNLWGDSYKSLLIMNGYISVKKPYLYLQNNRIKKIKVEGMKSGTSVLCDVKDTTHPQTVDISAITEPEDLKVSIVEVYKGTKYQDTAIHYLITYNDEVIPYDDIK